MGNQQGAILRYAREQIAASPVKGAALGALLLVFAIVVAVRLVHQPRAAEGAGVFPALAIPVGIAELPGLADAPARLPLPPMPTMLYRDPFGVDPAFRGLAPSQANPGSGSADNSSDDSDLALQAVCLLRGARGRPTAVINGFMLEVGDSIGRYVVEEIGPRHVVLRDGSVRRRLPMR